MSDLIDRQETIKQFCKQDCDCDPKDCLDKTCYEVEIIESVPTHTTPSNVLNSLDCVDRQKAIDEFIAFKDAHKADRFTGDFIHWTGIKAMIENLPSVQPKIIRCKDCKWFNKPGCSIWIVDDSDKPSEDDYCSFAELRGDSDEKCMDV